MPQISSKAGRKTMKTATLATMPRDMTTPMLKTPWWWATIRAPKLNRIVRAFRNTPMPALLNAVRAYATIGEMCDALRVVWGEYEEVAVI